MGTGDTICINQDKWISQPMTFSLQTKVKFEDGAVVGSLNNKGGTWSEEKIRTVFHPDDQDWVFVVVLGAHQSAYVQSLGFSRDCLYSINCGYMVNYRFKQGADC
uniref:Uncharacterized protein n=1 Tax=Cannabis sativa TaxID=3483 RepID=A0A803P0R2_CANSA